jgi:hypothetical protein
MKHQKLQRITKYSFVSLIGLLGIPFIGIALVYAFFGVQSDGHTINRVFESGRIYSNGSISLHMVFGASITALAPLQLLMGWTRKWMKTHRIIGYFFAIAACLTSLGGFLYVFLHGTTGGNPMNIAFSIYGLFLLIATFKTIQTARSKAINKHNEWALRLFILAMGSWFYRACYGFYFTLDPSGKGHTDQFDGYFDLIMNFGFFLPPLVLLEIYFYLNKKGKFNIHPLISSLATLLTAAILVIGTWWLFSRIIESVLAK